MQSLQPANDEPNNVSFNPAEVTAKQEDRKEGEKLCNNSSLVKRLYCVDEPLKDNFVVLDHSQASPTQDHLNNLPIVVKPRSDPLEKLIEKNRPNMVVLTLNPINQGLKIALRTSNGKIVHESELPYFQNELLDYINKELLPPILALEWGEIFPELFYRGCVFVEIKDCRVPSNKNNKFHMMLRPHNESVMNDVMSLINESKSKSCKMSEEKKINLERLIVHSMEHRLCLDPSPMIGKRKIHSFNMQTAFSTQPLLGVMERSSAVHIEKQKERKRKYIESLQKTPDFTEFRETNYKTSYSEKLISKLTDKNTLFSKEDEIMLIDKPSSSSPILGQHFFKLTQTSDFTAKEQIAKEQCLPAQKPHVAQSTNPALAQEYRNAHVQNATVPFPEVKNSSLDEPTTSSSPVLGQCSFDRTRNGTDSDFAAKQQIRLNIARAQSSAAQKSHVAQLAMNPGISALAQEFRNADVQYQQQQELQRRLKFLASTCTGTLIPESGTSISSSPVNNAHSTMFTLLNNKAYTTNQTVNHLNHPLMQKVVPRQVVPNNLNVGQNVTYNLQALTPHFQAKRLKTVKATNVNHSPVTPPLSNVPTVQTIHMLSNPNPLSQNVGTNLNRTLSGLSSHLADIESDA